MKKLLFTLLAILLTLSLSAALVSCGSEETSSAEGGSSEAETPSAEESSEVEQTDTSDPIAVENGLAVYMPESGELKIAQFADLHFGIEGNAYHNDKTARTKAYMQYVVETEKPDLIVCSGDNILSTGVEKLKEFV